MRYIAIDDTISHRQENHNGLREVIEKHDHAVPLVQIPDKTRPYPGVRIVSLVPVHT